MRPVFLIGYMGSGKTTLGRALSKATNLPFVDLDDYIEADKGMSIREIFAAEGETVFREAERDALHRLASSSRALIACGGGTPCFYDNIEFMNSVGVTVFLDASVERLRQRLSMMRSNRPLIASMSDDELGDYIVSSLEKRLPYYSRASYRFDADSLDSEAQLADSVSRFVDLYLADARKADDTADTGCPASSETL